MTHDEAIKFADDLAAHVDGLLQHWEYWDTDGAEAVLARYREAKEKTSPKG